MAKKQMMWKTKGMNQDLSVSAFNPEFAFENINLRFSTNEGNTMMSWVNERGTKKLTLSITYIHPEYWSKEGEDDVYTDPKDESWTHHDAYQDTTDSISGTPIGSAVLNTYLVLFTHKDPESKYSDKIYRFEYIPASSNNPAYMQGVMLFNGNLNLSFTNPLETLTSYEADHIQKIYWTDGINQPRMINIAPESDSKISKYTNTSFDSIPELQLNEDVYVEKIVGGNGTFAPGVIQYAFTYYNKYGQESNIFYVTPLLYISYYDRGASPEDRVDNTFKITVNNLDTNFDYLRIYSIQRTSINGTPIAKLVRDFPLADLVDPESPTDPINVTFIDNGSMGSSVDPTELLYKGGEVISAATLEQKDNTLFFGNLHIERKSFENEDDIKQAVTLSGDYTRYFKPRKVSSGYYDYSNQLTSTIQENGITKTVPCGGFKTGDFYRCGVQFQHKSGKWSDPIFINDVEITARPSEGTGNDEGKIFVPRIKGVFEPEAEIMTTIKDAGYKKIRPVIVFPNMSDREVICQGVAAPTVYTSNQREENKDIYAQSSWFFRPYIHKENNIPSVEGNKGITSFVPKGGTDIVSDGSSSTIDWHLDYTEKGVGGAIDVAYHPKYIRRVEIEGNFDEGNRFGVDRRCRTLHSPDLEFDTQYSSLDYLNLGYHKVAEAEFTNTASSIDIQTETPVISSEGAGFIHKSLLSESAAGIVSGLFYDDHLVDDNGNNLESYYPQKTTCKFLIYPWQGTGSLNNDFKRPTDKGTQTALLKKKVVSNLRYAKTNPVNYNGNPKELTFNPMLFNSDEDTILKVSYDLESLGEIIHITGIYKGNIDTMLIPDHRDGAFFALDSLKHNNGFYFDDEPSTDFDSIAWAKLSSLSEQQVEDYTLRKYMENGWWGVNDDIGESQYLDLVTKKSPVRMKYKSSPHLLIRIYNGNLLEGDGKDNDNNKLSILELRRLGETSSRAETRFGGKSRGALMENVWMPCGEPVRLPDNSNSVEFYYEYGDTYYQRWDCLKTYAFTPEDINQVVEIGSFMLETHTNIDGRYDRNRGQQNNLNMSPRNFNLMNPVYSQKDNFFSYKIMNKDYYNNEAYINQITWSKTKNSGADVDLWTNITLASILELDGDKGAINRLVRFNNQLICFQDSGICQVLYNENAQISTTQGVPVELGNSGKVDGKRYIHETIGCKNKWSIATGGNGIYFMDSNEDSIYIFNGQLTNLSTALGFNSWCKNNINGEVWNPKDFKAFTTFYDKKNQDILFVNNEIALAYSENLKVFTSFYNYGGAPYFNNLQDMGVWVSQANKSCTLWQHQAGEYCDFFSTDGYDGHKPYSMTLVGNPEPQLDKVFTNLEFRASVEGDGEQTNAGKFNFYLPFDSLETWNEYQHGLVKLDIKNGHAAMKHHTLDNEASLKRKFRIWRCDIPRDNAPLSGDAALGVSRVKAHPIDRMRNPWLYLKLQKDADTDKKVEIHDMMMTYFT